MKKYSLIFTLLISYFSQAQDVQFRLNNSCHLFSFSNINVNSSDRDGQFFVIGNNDTLINNIIYSKVIVIEVYGPSHVYNIWGYRGAIRQDTLAKKVYFLEKDSTIEKKIYDLSKTNLGDTIFNLWQEYSQGDLGYLEINYDVQILGVDTFYQGGKLLRQFHLGCTKAVTNNRPNDTVYSPIGWEGNLYESIGYEKGILYGPAIDPLFQPGYSPASISYNDTLILLNDMPSDSAGSVCPPPPPDPNWVKNLGADNRFNIGPNPNCGTFYVTTNQNNFSIIVTNLLGKNIYKTQSLGNNMEVNLGNRPKGIYFVTVKGEGINETKKVIIE